MELKIKLIEGGSLPSKATDGSAAFDCYSRGSSYNGDKGYLEVKLGFCAEVPKGYVMKLFPRSSVTNRGLMLGNSVGIIDSDYRGEVMARFYPNASSLIALMPGSGLKAVARYCEEVYRKGEAVAQFTIEKIEDVEINVVDELSETDRGEGGFGSTDKK